jgi:ABC-type sugar transport system substrate-binding protein
MKKVFAILLSALLCATAASCSGGSPNGSPSQSAPPAESPEISASPSESAPPVSPEVSAPAAATPAEPSATGSVLGRYADKSVDYFSREPYEFVYMVNGMLVIHQLLGEALADWGGRLNYNYSEYDSGSDMNAFLTTMETYATQGYDGFFVDPDVTVAQRTAELAEDLGIPIFPVLVPMRDSNDKLITPGLHLDSIMVGGLQTQWLIDNYKTYWGDVDPSEIGYLFLYASFNKKLVDNMVGARDRFQEVWPDTFEKNYYDGDCLALGVSIEAGFDYTSSILTSNPNVKYWFVSSCLEDYAQGAARAVEGLDMEDHVLILSNGANTLIPDWQGGYDGCWVAALHYANEVFTEPIACGLVAMVDGRAKPEDLWPEYKQPGEKYALYVVPTVIVTKDTYQDYLQYVEDFVNGLS